MKKKLQNLIPLSKTGIKKLLLTMKLALIIVFLTVLQVSANVYSQITVNMDVQDKSIREVLKTIEQQSQVRFFYSDDLLSMNEQIDIKADNKNIISVLDDIFSKSPLTYKAYDNNLIVIAPKELLQQQNRITGTVTDKDGTPLPGVNVVVQGTIIGAITDINGSYTIEVPDASAILRFSFIGYDIQEVAVAGKTVIDVALTGGVTGLEEVVVIGYGIQKKTTITGSVSVVKGADLARVPSANISTSLAGRLSGVSMRPNGGQPGYDNPDIYVRGIATTGTNNPLIIIDGIIRNNINQVDASTIESVTVLKDAAAASLYGLGGANGVILITTKKGALGVPILTLNSYYGWQQPTYFQDVLHAKDFMRLSNEAYLNEHPGSTATVFEPDLIANYDALHAEDPDRYPNSNTDDLVDMSVPIQNHNFQLSGGSESTKYFASMGYYKQDGIFDAINYRRFSYNMKVESKPTNSTTLSFSLLGSVERTNDIDASTTSNSLFRSLYRFVPTRPIYFSNGLWGECLGSAPVGVFNSGSYKKDDANAILSTITIEQQLPFIKGLSVKGTFSYDTRGNLVKGWHKPFYYWVQNLNTTPYTYTRQVGNQESTSEFYTFLSQTHEHRTNITYQGFVNYQRSFGLNEITGLFVAEARNDTYNMLFARRNNFAILVDEMNMGSSNKLDFDNTGSSSVGAQIGYVYRLGYIYNNKYMLEASGRYDGHYYFAPGKRWGYFPAFSIGWRISEENFMTSLAYINNLKIRGSWGKAGNLAGSAYQYLSGYTLYGNSYAFGTGQMVQGAYSPREANPNITWEISTNLNVGFEASLWNSLLMVEADYFLERRTGMLLAPAIKVPIEYGLALADENAGEMKNQGFELTLGSRYEFQNGLRLGFDGNLSVAKNKMTQVFETAATFNNPNRSRTGRPYGTPFGYHSLGLFSTADDKNGDGIIDITEYPVTQFGALHPGDIKYEDISGPGGNMIPDGKIDGNDEVSIGYPVYPLMSFGFTPNAEWKGFDLSLFFQGSGMSSFRIATFQTIPFQNANSNSDYEYFNDHWTPTTQDATYPRATSGPYPNNTQDSDFWMRNTSFLRLKTGTLGYSLPTSVIQFLKVKSVRVYFSSQNLFTLSKLKFMDPEMSYTRRETGYPNMKSLSFGANIIF